MRRWPAATQIACLLTCPEPTAAVLEFPADRAKAAELRRPGTETRCSAPLTC